MRKTAATRTDDAERYMTCLLSFGMAVPLAMAYGVNEWTGWEGRQDDGGDGLGSFGMMND